MAMVFCRGCGKEIHPTAPICPHCGAPQQVAVTSADIPDGVRGWSWGAFLFNWIWAIGNRVWLGLLALVPFVGWIMAIILGVKGREWAWKSRQWESVEQFNKVQRQWSKWGVILTLVGLVLTITVVALTPDQGTAGYISMVKGGTLQSCPGKTLEQQANSFFGSPDWDSGVSSDGQKYVNISGPITYMGKDAKAVLQFVINTEDGSFKYNALEINGLPQNNLIAAALLSKMCQG